MEVKLLTSKHLHLVARLFFLFLWKLTIGPIKKLPDKIHVIYLSSCRESGAAWINPIIDDPIVTEFIVNNVSGFMAQSVVFDFRKIPLLTFRRQVDFDISR